MPRGKYTNHKGKGRRFTSVEELEEQRKQDENYRRKKAEPGMESSEEEESGEEGSGSEDGSDSDDGPQKSKGVESLIEVQNPNRKPSKPKKLTEVDEEVAEAAPPQLSRREKEEIEKNKKRAAYNKLHAQGKTAQAKADLARLAIIKQQREEAAKRREAEKQEKEAQKQTKAAEIQKVLGKKIGNRSLSYSSTRCELLF